MTLSRSAVMVAASRVLGVAAVVVAALLVVPAESARADDVRNRSWHLQALGLPELHAVSQGAGITVAVVDTGVDANHPDLAGNVLPGLDFGNESTKGHSDQVGHGTAMASLIAGHGHGPGGGDGVLGVAPKAKILPINVSVVRGSAINISPDAIAGGIRWAADNGAQVISVSLHSASSDPDLDSAILYAFRKGIFVVAATGNAKDIAISSAARHAGATAVSGTDRSGGFGPESLEAKETDIAAPSVDLVRAAPGGGYSTETSVSGATALVAGAFAVVKSKYPQASRNEVLERVLWTTTDAGDSGRDAEFGWGVLNLRQALTGQPQKRGTPAADPTGNPSGPTDYGVGLSPGYEDEFDTDELIAAIIAGVLVVGVVVGLIFWIRRRRRRRAALGVPVGAPLGPAPPGMSDPATGGFAYGGYPPAGQPPVGQPPPGPYGSPGDDSGWVRPPGDSHRPAP